MTSTRARPLYFDSSDGPLFGWYHAPVGPVREAAVVVCPPFGVEAVFAGRALRHLAEGLSELGFPVLRYDHRGTGDSPGDEHSPGLVAAWRNGVRAALDAVRVLSAAPRSAVVALRFGATIAGVAAAELGTVDSMALWAPVVSGRRYSRELRAFAQTGPGDDGVGGIPVTRETLTGIESLDLASVARAPASHILIVPRDDLPDDDALSTAFTQRGAVVKTVTAPGYASTMVEPHNTVVPTAVIDAMSSWLAERHPVAVHATTPEFSALTSTSLEHSASAGPVKLTERPAFLDPSRRLFGIVTEPAVTRSRSTAILLVNAGAVSRIGPHRFYVALAREWASAGFHVLRMDLGGIGDSIPTPGAPENHTYPDAASADITAGIDSLRKMGAKSVVVVGLCSGAHAAYHLALDRADRADLAGVVMINPIVFYWHPGDALDVSAWQNYVDAKRLQRVVRTRDAWARLVRGEVDVASVAQTFLRRIVTIAGAAVDRARARLNLSATDNLARDLVGLAERPLDIAMVFSEGDPGRDQLMLQAKHVLGRLQRRPNFSVTIVRGADHTFTPLESQTAVRQVLFDHLTKRFA